MPEMILPEQLLKQVMTQNQFNGKVRMYMEDIYENLEEKLKDITNSAISGLENCASEGVDKAKERLPKGKHIP